MRARLGFGGRIQRSAQLARSGFAAPLQRRQMGSAAAPEIAVLMCGLPGRMGHSVAEAVVRRWGPDALLPFSLTGPDEELDSVEVVGKGAVELLRPDTRDAAWAKVEEAAAGRLIVATDYTHPDAAVANCAWFRTKNVPFVMGTTGYDVEAAHAAIGPDLYAVLAPNMGKPIVLFQAMLEHAACASLLAYFQVFFVRPAFGSLREL